MPRSLAGRHSLSVGIVCTLCNPLSPLMWLSIVGVSSANGATLQFEHLGLVGAGYLLGKLTWTVLLATLLGWGRVVIKPRVWRWWNSVSACLLGGYGMQLFWSMIR